MVDSIMAIKIRKYIKLLKGKFEKYTLKEAFNLISKEFQMKEALKDDEMDEINDDILTRLKENWPFRPVI